MKTTRKPTFVVVKRLELLWNINFTSQNENVIWDLKIILLDLIFTHLSLCVEVHFIIFTSHYVLNLLLAQFTLFWPNLSHVLEAYCSSMFLTIWSGQNTKLEIFWMKKYLKTNLSCDWHFPINFESKWKTWIQIVLFTTMVIKLNWATTKTFFAYCNFFNHKISMSTSKLEVITIFSYLVLKYVPSEMKFCFD